MSSSIQSLVEHACISPNTSADLGRNATSFALRGGVKLFTVRPGTAQSVPMTPGGSYFCISISGPSVIWCEADHPRLRACRPHVLHVLRQPDGRSARQINFDATTSLAVVVYFPASWCAECPRGPECQVGRFLMLGDEGEACGRDLEMELDERGMSHARALLDLNIEQDSDILAAEQAALALLSWAYHKHANPQLDAMTNQVLPSRTVTKLRLAVDILSQRLDDPPTIAELSTLVGMNECDLKRCFKCRYGDSIASFSRNKRLATAQGLLLHSGLSIAEIALEVGFANPSQFARAFRRQFDVNPAEYRRSPQHRGQ